MKNVGLFFAFVLAGCLMSCATHETGKQIDLGHTAQLVKGRTTKSEVHGLFGDPQNKSVTSAGEMWIYNYSKSKSAVTAGGVAMGLVGIGGQSKGETSTQTLTVTFQGDVLQDFSYTEGGQGSTSTAF
jgi:hypothetical protein